MSTRSTQHPGVVDTAAVKMDEDAPFWNSPSTIGREPVTKNTMPGRERVDAEKNTTRWGAKGQQAKAQFLYNAYRNLNIFNQGPEPRRTYLTKTLNLEVLQVT